MFRNSIILILEDKIEYQIDNIELSNFHFHDNKLILTQLKVSMSQLFFFVFLRRLKYIFHLHKIGGVRSSCHHYIFCI